MEKARQNGHAAAFNAAEFVRVNTVEDEQPQESRRKQLLHANELDLLPPPSFHDQQGEFPANALAVVYGLSGGGKSFYALDKAFHLSQTHNVVYVAAEGATGYAARKNALQQHYNQQAGSLYFWPYAVNLLSDGDVQEFLTAIAHLEKPIVILDTLARCMVGGDENSAKDMGLAIAACDTIRHATGETVAVVHHTGKNGSTERGSSALRGAADVMIEVQNDDGLISLSCSKMKDAKPFEPRHLRLIEVGESCVLVPSSRVITTKEAPLTARQRQVLEMLDLSIFVQHGAKAVAIAESTGMPKATLYKTLDRLHRLGYISQSNRGDPYYITDAGSNKLREDEYRSLANSAHQEAEVSIVSSESTQVSGDSSLQSTVVSPPYRGETRETIDRDKTIDQDEGAL